MTKKITIFLALVLTLALVTGCAGTPVIYYTNCTCPVGGHTQEPTPPGGRRAEDRLVHRHFRQRQQERCRRCQR